MSYTEKNVIIDSIRDVSNEKYTNYKVKAHQVFTKRDGTTWNKDYLFEFGGQNAQYVDSLVVGKAFEIKFEVRCRHWLKEGEPIDKEITFITLAGQQAFPMEPTHGTEQPSAYSQPQYEQNESLTSNSDDLPF